MSRSSFKSVAGIAVSIFVGLLAAGLLPVYPRRSMTRSMMSGGGGDRISYGFELESLSSFVENWRYLRHDDYAVVNIVVVLVLALIIAAGFGTMTWLVWRRFSKG